VDTPIDIPDRHKVAPLVLPAAPVVPQAEAVVSAPEAAQRPVSAVVPGQPLPAAKAINQAEIIETVLEKNTPIAPASKASVAIKNIASEASKQAKPGASATVPAKPAKAAISAAASAAPAKPTEAAKALALLEGKAADVPPVVAAGRFVVQVGAFAEVVRAREARLKVEQAGLKTYTQVAETKDGKRIRVRVGPFATKAEAEKAADKIKKLNLPAALLTL
jgi:DedD protein